MWRWMFSCANQLLHKFQKYLIYTIIANKMNHGQTSSLIQDGWLDSPCTNTFDVMRRGSDPDWIDNWSLCLFCCLYACLFIDITVRTYSFPCVYSQVYQQTFYMQISLGVRNVLQSIQCTVCFPLRFVFKLLVPSLTFALHSPSMSLLPRCYICRRSRTLCMSKNRWVTCSETFSIALFCVFKSVIKDGFYFFIKLWEKKTV